MKKIISLFSVLLLTACSASQTKETKSKASSEVTSSLSSPSSSSSEKASTSQSPESSSSASEPSPSTVSVDYSLYDQVIVAYHQVLNQGAANSDVNPEAGQAATGSYYTGLDYSLYDLDKNGVDELIIALVAKDGYRSLLDLRTIKDGQVVRLTTDENQLSMIGNRTILLPLADGSFYYKASGGASGGLYAHYRWTADGVGLEKVAEATSEAGLGNLPAALDLKTLTWQSVSSLAPQTSASQTETASSSSGMDLQAIAKGDYSSIVGTWKSGKADWPTLTISTSSIQASYPDGRVSTFFLETSDNPNITKNGYLSVLDSEGLKHGYAGGLWFIPVGVTLSEGTVIDASDSSKERLFLFGGGMNPEVVMADPDSFYYKVSD